MKLLDIPVPFRLLFLCFLLTAASSAAAQHPQEEVVDWPKAHQRLTADTAALHRQIRMLKQQTETCKQRTAAWKEKHKPKACQDSVVQLDQDICKADSILRQLQQQLAEVGQQIEHDADSIRQAEQQQMADVAGLQAYAPAYAKVLAGKATDFLKRLYSQMDNRTLQRYGAEVEAYADYPEIKPLLPRLRTARQVKQWLHQADSLLALPCTPAVMQLAKQFEGLNRQKAFSTVQWQELYDGKVVCLLGYEDGTARYTQFLQLLREAAGEDAAQGRSKVNKWLDNELTKKYEEYVFSRLPYIKVRYFYLKQQLAGTATPASLLEDAKFKKFCQEMNIGTP
ncbi:MAG: hypothetical protein MR605_04670 [Bacteroidales bacterium]|nr:hypothetical protein [Bacteroidales bacterium]